MNREEPELLTDISDFTTQFYGVFVAQVLRFVRVVYREGFRDTICNMEP